MKQRLDILLARTGLVGSRSAANSTIRLGKVRVNGQSITRPETFIDDKAEIELADDKRYVSRAGLKLASVVNNFSVQFEGKVVLDVGSSTGGFTDYALQHGARKVYAVELGTEQLHQSLRGDRRIWLHEKTDIRDFTPPETPDIIVMDVSFISLREILPHIAKIATKQTQILEMVKPQFEATPQQTNKGIIKNDSIRRQILKDFEAWAKRYFVIVDKSDSEVAGQKGNHERFYLMNSIVC